MTEETWLQRRIICSGIPCRCFDALPTLDMINETFFQRIALAAVQVCSVFCTAITRSLQFGTANTMGLSSAWRKGNLGTPFCLSAVAFFDEVLVCISSLISQDFRGSSFFSIVLFLTRVSLDCNIKCTHSTF